MKITRSRTFLQVRIGRNAIAEVVLNVRLADLEWINKHDDRHNKEQTKKQQQQQQQQQKGSDSDDHNDDDGPSTTERNKTVLQEFFHLLQTSILPRIMGNEIEECNYYHGGRERKPPPLGPGGIPINVVAEKNKRNTTTTVCSTNSTNNKRGSKNKKGAAAVATAAAAAGTKRKRAGAGKHKLEPPPVQADEDRSTRIERDVFYAFGESMQVAYRWEDLIHEQKHSTVTLVYSNDTSHVNDDSSTTKAPSSTTLNSSSSSSSSSRRNMRQLQPLSKRILAWCYPYDPNNPSEPDPPGGGFPLPERIPIASLFRGRGGRET